MYIYIYRILLNKFVLYTAAIYTTVSPTAMPVSLPLLIFAHSPSFCTPRRKKRQIIRGRRSSPPGNPTHPVGHRPS